MQIKCLCLQMIDEMVVIFQTLFCRTRKRVKLPILHLWYVFTACIYGMYLRYVSTVCNSDMYIP